MEIKRLIDVDKLIDDVLLRTQFWNNQDEDVFLDIINQQSVIQIDLLENKEKPNV
jgi:hypothetical protein